MKNDAKSLISGKVDVTRIKYSKGVKLGFDLANEIDVWDKMVFRNRQQIKHLHQYGTLKGHQILYDINSLVYAVREKID